MEPGPGIMVTPSVRLIRMVGTGGMGSVWVADHLGLATKVAVKFISAEIVQARPLLLERFKREAGIAARIKSPHVVQVFDHGLAEDGTPYIVMELLEGESLRQRLKRERRLDTRHTAMLVAQTSQVLGRAHKVAVVHRDIKPANIFLASTEYELFIKVLDFGIAKQEELEGDSSTTTTGLVMGSPLYMSPEQFLSAKDVDFRADLWSLSVVAYQALVGRPPFAGDTAGRVMRAEIERREYQPPSKLRPDLGTTFDRWFARAFARDIEERYQSADELARSFLAQCGEHAGGGLGGLSSTAPSIEELAGSSSFELEPAPNPTGSDMSPAPMSTPAGPPAAVRGGHAKPVDADADPAAGTEVDGPPTLEDDPAETDGDPRRPAAPASTTLPSASWRFGRRQYLSTAAVAALVILGGMVLSRTLWRDGPPSGRAGAETAGPGGSPAGEPSEPSGAEPAAPSAVRTSPPLAAPSPPDGGATTGALDGDAAAPAPPTPASTAPSAPTGAPTARASAAGTDPSARPAATGAASVPSASVAPFSSGAAPSPTAGASAEPPERDYGF